MQEGVGWQWAAGCPVENSWDQRENMGDIWERGAVISDAG